MMMKKKKKKMFTILEEKKVEFSTWTAIFLLPRSPLGESIKGPLPVQRSGIDGIFSPSSIQTSSSSGGDDDDDEDVAIVVVFYFIYFQRCELS